MQKQSGKTFFLYLFSFLLTINLKLITVHVEIKIVNKEAVTKQSTLLHAQRDDIAIAPCSPLASGTPESG